ncbi:hypothetical protein QR680_006400 [Steinernema hermaphroditum]|uniref:Tr-type G domain-containing protein n=1 Tax=Steinernema hermaphroditum TaxID=289476 RepID=A0AA39HWJ6_9BILA|nr:hypothetical protein QR680_006400 [Steinernema hermaphroditum]
MNRLLKTGNGVATRWTQSRSKSFAKGGHGHFRKTPNLEVPMSDIRNIGIIAHIDAGKTTVTERLLYMAGATTAMGDVDSGTTLTDFMELERERGITIQSAAVTLFWHQNRINLIDTPGHVDFQLEVERCARVLDGAVTVLDGSAGVQAQTLTVWRQASKFRLPSVFFVNKMDKPGADFRKSLDSIKQKLQMQGVPVCVPHYENGRLVSVIDLIRKEKVDFGSEKADWKPVEEKSALADADESFANYLLESETLNVENEQLIPVLRNATLDRKLSPVACGSALRTPASVRTVLDNVIHYLPSPDQRNSALNSIFGDELSGLVFKVGHDKRQGQLSYVRLYTGEIRNNSAVYNANKALTESNVKVFIPHSDELQPVDHLGAGNIAVVTGLKQTITGDTLIKNEHHGKEAAKRRSELVHHEKNKRHSSSHHRDLHDIYREIELGTTESESDDTSLGSGGHSNRVVLAGIEAPDPVYFCSIEPPSAGAIHQFEKALQELVTEDPSIRVRQDSECGQTILEAMGELHIEVVKDRLQRDYGLNVFLGPLQVGYREVINKKLVHTCSVEDDFGEQKRHHQCSLTFEVEPTEKLEKFKKVNVDLDADCAVPFIRNDWLKAINDGCKNALHNGPVFGYPVSNVVITLKSLTASGGKLNPALLSACASQCLTEAFRNAGAHLMEPVMDVEITVTDEAARSGVNAVLHELGKRRANIQGVDGDAEKGNAVIVRARMPLAETTGIASAIRTATSGLGNLHMQFADYEHVSEHDQAMIVARGS